MHGYRNTWSNAIQFSSCLRCMWIGNQITRFLQNCQILFRSIESLSLSSARSSFSCSLESYYKFWMRMRSSSFLFGYIHYSFFSHYSFATVFFFLSFSFHFLFDSCSPLVEFGVRLRPWAFELVKNVIFIRNSAAETVVNEINVWSKVGRYKMPQRHVSMVLEEKQTPPWTWFGAQYY